MRQLLFLLVLLVTAFAGQAQISGQVIDGITGKPLPNANIFISGTSKGTVSDGQGQFYLQDIPAGKYDLIISMVGYETIVHSFGSPDLPLKLKVQMEKKVVQEETVTVVPFEKDGWERWGLLFMQTFIGESVNASRCKILNKEVVRFRYNKKEKTLEAVADDILIIENKSLGYRIKYQLEGFVYNTTYRSVVYLGYPLFEEMEKGRPAKYYKNRKKAYYGSIMHLMRALYSNTTSTEGFEIRPITITPNTEKKRIKELYNKKMVSGSDSSYYYSRVLRQPDSFESTGAPWLNTDSLLTPGIDDRYKILSFPGALLVHYKNEPESSEYARANPFTFKRPDGGGQTTRLYFINDARQVQIEANGNYYNPIDLSTDGYMGWEKMGDMLPLDYQPPSEN